MEQPTMVTVDRWSSYRGALVSLRWPMEQPPVVTAQVVLIQRCFSITEVAHGAATSDHCRQVVLIQKCIIVSLKWPMHEAATSGHCRQVVLIQRCFSITEVAHGAATMQWSL